MRGDIKAGGAYVELMLRKKKFTAGLKAAGKRLARFGKAVAMAGAAAAAAAAGGIAYGIRQYMRMGDELDKMSQRTGLSVEALSELKHAAKQSGGSIDDVERSTKRMQKTLLDARRGLQSSRDAFENLGLSVEGIAAMSPEDQFTTIAEALNSVEDASLRAGLAQNVFGRSGTTLIPMLNNMKSLRGEAKDMGMSMSTEAASGAARLLDMFSILGAQGKSLMFEIGAAAAPLLEGALPTIQDFLSQTIGSIRDTAGNVRSVVSAMFMTVSSFVTSTAELWSSVFSSMATVTGEAWGFITGQTGSAMGLFQDLVHQALKVVTFRFAEWSGLVEMATVSAQLAVVRFTNEIKHFFGTEIPGYLGWLADNWWEIFVDLVNITETTSKNIWENLKNLWDGIISLFNGDGFVFEWTPLTEGFRSAIKELPQIAEREMGPLEASLNEQLNSIANDMVGKYEKHSEEFDRKAASFASSTFTAPDSPDAPTMPDSPSSGLGLSSARKKEVFSSFNAAAIAGQSSGGSKSTDRKIDAVGAELKRQTAIMRRAASGGTLV